VLQYDFAVGGVKEFSQGRDPSVWHPSEFLSVFEDGLVDPSVNLVLVDGEGVQLTVGAVSSEVS